MNKEDVGWLTGEEIEIQVTPFVRMELYIMMKDEDVKKVEKNQELG